MIKFFRRFRHRLIGESLPGRQTGKFSKYLLYAFGEIVLVVIGILIALGINNWNQDRKQHANDIEFLKNLRSEVVLDSISISRRISTYHNINGHIKTTIELLDTASVLTPSQFTYISKTIEETEVLLPTYKNLDRNGSILSSGALNRLDPNINKSYLDYLDSFKFSYDLSNKLTTSLNDAINKELYPNVDLNFTNLSEDHIRFNLENLKGNRSFFNALQKSIWYRSTVLSTLEPLLQESKSLIDQIDSQLLLITK